MKSETTAQTQMPPSVVLIFGIAKGRFRPQAARFRADEIELARFLAAQLNLTVLPIDPQLLQEIGLVIPEWQLRPDDQAIVPYIRGQVFEQLQQLAQSGTEVGTEITGGAAVSQGTALVPKPVIDAKQAARLWDGIAMGSLVLALDVDEAGEHVGWWEAVVLAVQGETYLLRWREPLEGVIRRRRHQLSLLHPDSDCAVEGEG